MENIEILPDALTQIYKTNSKALHKKWHEWVQSWVSYAVTNIINMKSFSNNRELYEYLLFLAAELKKRLDNQS